MLIINVLVFILQFFLLIWAIKIFIHNPLDFSALFIFLYIVFYASAYWDYFFGLGLYSNSLLEHFNVEPNNETVSIFNFYSTFIMIAFEFGYSLKRRSKSIKRINYNYTIKDINFKILSCFMILIWLFITFIGFRNYGGSIKMFFSPARKTIYTSGYLISLVVIIPTVLLSINVINNQIKNKSNISSIIFIIMLIATQMSLGQRREIINGIIFIFLLNLTVSYTKIKKYTMKLYTNFMRKKILFLGIFVSILIPLLWWGRTYFTQIQRGDANIIMPWQLRGWFELLFGSSTTGFQTTLIIDNFKSNFGLKWLHSILFIISIAIPRSVFPNKPMTITKTIQFALNDGGNMSLFYINDVYFNFGVLSIIMSFFIGMLISYLYNVSYNSNKLHEKVFSLIMLSQIILLFKNGFAQYFIMIFQYFLVLRLSLKFILKRNRILENGADKL